MKAFVGSGISVAGPADRRDVVEQRVEPHVHDAAAAGNLNAPRKVLARDREIFQPAFEDRHHFVVDAARTNPIRVRAKMFEQAVAIRGEPEEPGVFGEPLDLSPAGRAASLYQPRLQPEGLVVDAVPAFVRSHIDVAIGSQPLEDGLHDAFVPRLGRADEVVVPHVVGFEQRLPTRYEPVAPFLRRRSGCGGRVRDLLPVLVYAGQEVRFARGPRGARQNVGYDRRVGVADMGVSADIVDRRCNVIDALHLIGVFGPGGGRDLGAAAFPVAGEAIEVASAA